MLTIELCGTVGDCYVAVCGCPEAREDHAVAMAQFSRECIEDMKSLVENEMPEMNMSSLRLRVGIHSGSVTGGMLRGDRSRFQLFGDTMNLAARMESTGEPNKAQMSAATAKLLRESGKLHWVKAREDIVEVKGKEEMATYWLQPAAVLSSICSSELT